MSELHTAIYNLKLLVLEPAANVIKPHGQPNALLGAHGRHNPDWLARVMLHQRIGDTVPRPTWGVEKQRNLIKRHKAHQKGRT